MSWNHRILAHKHKEDVHFQVHEVYYTNGIADAYTKDPVTVNSDTIKGVYWCLNKMLEATKKPVLWAGENFPNECKVKYVCDLCGKDTFDKPMPHVCKNGLRKRGLSWSLNCH